MARCARLWSLLLVAGLVSSAGAAHAQGKKAEEEFSLDEDDTAADAAAKKPQEGVATGKEEEKEEVLLSDEQALEEEQAPDERYRKSTDPYEDPEKAYFFAGVNWRYLRMPSWAIEWGVESAPSIGSSGSFFGEFAYRKDGFQITADVGWVKFHMKGPFQLSGDPPADTEWLNGPFNMLTASATFTWSTSFTDWMSLDYGVEAGILFLFGDLTRTEAYRDHNGKWQKCPGWVDPADPNHADPTRNQVALTDPGQLNGYCAPPLGKNGGAPPPTNNADEDGEHYGVKANKGLFNKGVPHALPVLGPRISLRFKPIHQLVLRVDVPLPVFPFGFMGGLAAQYGF
jgi:hypothetical protein